MNSTYPEAIRFVAAQLILGGVVLSSLGCGSVIRISHSLPKGQSKQRVDGIPFYVKTATCKQETVWIEPTYDLTLSTVMIKDGKEVTEPVGVKTISQRTYDSKEYRALVARLANVGSGQAPSDVLKIFIGTEDYSAIHQALLPDRNDRFLASNQTTSETVVNYSDVYFYNAKKPVVGTVSASAELNPDGTLSKGSAQVEDKTLQTFLDLLPIKDILSGVAKGAGILGLDTSADLRFKLSAQPHVYKYTLTKYVGIPSALPCDPPAAPLESVTGVAIVRSTIATDDASKKDGSGTALKFSGTVDLPNQLKPASSTGTGAQK